MLHLTINNNDCNSSTDSSAAAARLIVYRSLDLRRARRVEIESALTAFLQVCVAGAIAAAKKKPKLFIDDDVQNFFFDECENESDEYFVVRLFFRHATWLPAMPLASAEIASSSPIHAQSSVADTTSSILPQLMSTVEKLNVGNDRELQPEEASWPVSPRNFYVVSSMRGNVLGAALPIVAAKESELHREMAERDIQQVMNEASCTRSEAIEALSLYKDVDSAVISIVGLF